MKKIFWISSTALLLIALSGTMVVSAQGVNDSQYNSTQNKQLSISQEVPIKDPLLKKAIKSKLQLSDSDKITTENILKLRELRTSHLGISDLSGLEYAKNLSTITFDTEKISNLSPLENLNALYSVGVQNCPLKISEVLKLKNITELNVSGIQDTQEEFNRLAMYKDMTVLFMDDCGLNDTSFISSMRNLRNLRVDSNNLSQINGINTDLINNLSASHNKIVSINTTMLGNVKELNLDDNSISDININDLKSINDISLNKNKIKSLKINNITNLKTLSLDDNMLTSVSINNERFLGKISLRNNNLLTIDKLTEVPDLRELNLTGNTHLNNIDFLSKLSSLQGLSLQSCKEIKDFSSISNLKILKTLLISDTDITDSKIKEIGYLEDLNLLAAFKNKITSLSFIEQFPNIKQLNLNENFLSDISKMPKNIEYYCQNQSINLVNGQVNIGTQIALHDSENNTPLLSNWIGKGELKIIGDKQFIIWSTIGNNSFEFSTTNKKFSGTVYQKIS